MSSFHEKSGNPGYYFGYPLLLGYVTTTSTNKKAILLPKVGFLIFFSFFFQDKFYLKIGDSSGKCSSDSSLPLSNQVDFLRVVLIGLVYYIWGKFRCYMHSISYAFWIHVQLHEFLQCNKFSNFQKLPCWFNLCWEIWGC